MTITVMQDKGRIVEVGGSSWAFIDIEAELPSSGQAELNDLLYGYNELDELNDGEFTTIKGHLVELTFD